MDYLEALDLLHQGLRPTSYVEIGCRKGYSLSRAECPSIGIDPDFEISQPLLQPTRIFKTPSDEFFRDHDLKALLGEPVSFAFIDGMHLAEYALRDFMNLERHAAPDSVIAIDDILPADIAWATRERETRAWTGDVYKVISVLKTRRPDLTIRVFDVEMKGIAVISGLNPEDRSLDADLDAIVAELRGSRWTLSSVEEIRALQSPEPPEALAEHVAELAEMRRSRKVAPPVPGAGAYLDLLKRSLLNEIYLDDELRLLYLRECIAGREAFDYGIYHDIRDTRPEGYEALRSSREIGQFPLRDIHKSGFSHTMMGRRRLDSLHHCLDIVRRNNIAGDLMECGVWRGGGCILMRGYLHAHGMENRRVLVADSFEGLPKPSAEQDAGLDLHKDRFPELAVSQTVVERNFEAYGLLDPSVVFLKGWFSETLGDAPTDRLALLRLDGDLYESTLDALTALYDKVEPGGIVIIDDFGALPVCREAVEDFFAQRGESVPAIEVIDWTGVYFVKPGAAEV